MVIIKPLAKQEGLGPLPPPPIEKLPMIKMMTQSLLIQFLLAFLECISTCVQRLLAITKY